MKQIFLIAKILSFIACLNYGIISIFEFNPLVTLLIDYPFLLKLFYFLFSLSAFLLILKKE